MRTRKKRNDRRSSFFSSNSGSGGRFNDGEPDFPVKFTDGDEEKRVGGDWLGSRNVHSSTIDRDGRDSRGGSWYSRTDQVSIPPEAEESTFRRSKDGKWKIPMLGMHIPSMHMPHMNWPHMNMPNMGMDKFKAVFSRKHPPPQVPEDVEPTQERQDFSFVSIPIPSQTAQSSSLLEVPGTTRVLSNSSQRGMVIQLEEDVVSERSSMYSELSNGTSLMDPKMGALRGGTRGSKRETGVSEMRYLAQVL